MKRISLLLLIFGIFSCTKEDALENTGSSYFMKLLGTSNIDNVADVKELNALDGYILVGTTTTKLGTKDIFAAKFDVYGNEVWQNTYGGVWDDEGFGVTELDDGNFVLCGSSMIKLDTVNAVLIKIDAFGNKIWENTYGYETSKQVANAVIPSHDGGLVFVGSTTAEKKSGIKIENPQGKKDFYFVVTDVDGKLIDEESRGSLEDDEFLDVIKSTFQNGYLTIGTTFGFADETQGGSNIMLVHTNSKGKERAQKTYGTSANDFGYGLMRYEQGYMMIGSSNQNGSSNVYLAKFEENNVTSSQWEKKYVSENQIIGSDITTTFDGTISIVGTSENTEENKDVYMLQVDRDGNKLNEKTFGDEGNEEGKAIIATQEGGYLIVGTSLVEFTQMVTLIKTKDNGDIQ